MAILVLGGAGYIGSHAVKKLLDSGEKVVVVDNLSTGFRQAVDSRAAFYECDIADDTRMDRVFEENEIEAVLHFAAFSLVGESMEAPLKYFQNNTGTMLTLLEKLNQYGVRHLVFSSTAAVYGEPETVPIHEETQKRPTSPYGESKLMMERIISWVSRTTDLSFVSLRYFNVAGASKDASIGESHQPETHLIPIVLEYASGKRDALYVFGNDYDTADGTCIRDYIHVEDLIDAHILALKYLMDGGASDIFNLGYNRGYSILDIIRTAEAVTGREIDFEYRERRPGDPSVLVANADKAMDTLGWQPQHDNIEEIITDAWQWHQKNPDGWVTHEGTD
ncbi:UDP-glucose 4-epimerase GalE [Salinicoccus hispanicus]|uniref:UDP-glucose 4-epimerase n=1 Tax=Salinicoccus hispanicus TaxID=157225 RepID=A0A6N8U3L2_9STAP|nr:UDP-glucose 4-epimerase GalE [Salinicoccus hispanicus]MXQ51025.1 UDP-glucose 4-epimerase GalE [Salinicoccus hispanicus]